MTDRVPGRVVSEPATSLSRTGRTWRLAATGVVGALFLTGTFVGDDPWWPFGPWRMYSTSTKATGAVWSTGVQITTAKAPGEWVDTNATPRNIGINRAELEGRFDQIEADPSMLATLAEAHARLHPEDDAWTGVRIVRRQFVIEDRQPTGEVRMDVFSTWEEGR
ncbi:hypothetical protein [Janibacter sp. G1551]|uniref:hypothetical protein n=1 Tax=Janibacter sp. G1551 TaxID=3420440 RepID=UPI003D04A7B6